MRLSDHLLKTDAERGAEPQARTSPPGGGTWGSRPVASEAPAADPLAALKARANDALVKRLGSRLYDASLSPEQLEEYVTEELNAVLEEQPLALTPAERADLVHEIGNDVLGYGPLERYLADPTVTEVMVNAENPIYIERGGKLYRTDERFGSEARLRQVIDRIVSGVGRRIDESSPMVDARLPDGSRVNAVIPPLAVDGSALTIRKFARKRLGLDDLVAFGTLTHEATELLDACIRGRLNMVISGGTGTGKTTLLNVLSALVSEDERIVTIEDAAELQLAQEHLVRLESRPPNLEGRGDISIRDLMRNALRMRPDRIIVGEVRGPEALDMLQAMNTGHDGSLTTLHANSPRDALSRIETMVLMAGFDLPVRAIRDQVASAIDVIIHLSRLRDGSRRVTQITEVVGTEGDLVALSDVFVFDFSAGIDDEGRYQGTLAPTRAAPELHRPSRGCWDRAAGPDHRPERGDAGPAPGVRR